MTCMYVMSFDLDEQKLKTSHEMTSIVIFVRVISAEISVARTRHCAQNCHVFALNYASIGSIFHIR
jgi:hypothetical protein